LLEVNLINNGSSPVKPNIYVDKYRLVDINGNEHDVSFDLMSYPSNSINPGDSKHFSSKN